MSAPRHLRYSRQQERSLAKRRGGRRRPLSGGGVLKEDEADAVALAQCKYTEKNSVTIHHKDLVKLYLNAVGEDRLPFMEILFKRQNPLENLRVYIVFQNEFTKYFPGGKG